MAAVGRFMGFMWHLREWRIGHPYLKTVGYAMPPRSQVVLGPRGVDSGG